MAPPSGYLLGYQPSTAKALALQHGSDRGTTRQHRIPLGIRGLPRSLNQTVDHTTTSGLVVEALVIG
jgi:hypothetical protein